LLAILAQDNDAVVREAVAANVATPSDLLAILAQDNNATVRKAIPTTQLSAKRSHPRQRARPSVRALRVK
jgi:hypothetical protein